MELEQVVLRVLEFVIALSAVAAIFFRLFKRGVEQALEPMLDDITTQLSAIKAEVEYNSGSSLKDKVRQLDISVSALNGQIQALILLVGKERRGDS